MTIEIETIKSLFLRMSFNGELLSTGTGFLALAPRGPVLVTNRHNLTGRRQGTNEPMAKHGGVPNEVVVSLPFHPKEGVLTWVDCRYPLYDSDENRLWFEHPAHGSDYDFVALPLVIPSDLPVYAHNLSASSNPILLRTSETVSIVGFPFSLTSAGAATGPEAVGRVGYFGIWSSGFVASEQSVDYGGRPIFLVDCRGRPGQSGSPVLAVRSGMVTHQDGRTANYFGRFTEFVGIYSGRVNEQSDLGFVWKRSAIQELVSSLA